MHPLARESLNAGETLPPFYGEDTLVLLARDPYWLFSYWELTWDTSTAPVGRGNLWSQGKKCSGSKNLTMREKKYLSSISA
jgi:hypothetical protein